jgi:hypothetical protein
MPATSGPPNSAEIAENEPAVATTLSCVRAETHEQRDRHADRGAEGDQRRLRPEHCPKRERAECGESQAGRIAERRHPSADPCERAVTSVAGQQHARGDDDRAPATGSPITRNHGAES